MQRKVLFVLMPDGYRDEEFSVPYEMVTKAGHITDVAGLKPGIAQGSRGHTFTPTLIVDKLTNKDLAKYDAIIIPGGPGSPTHLWDNPRIQEMVQYFHKHNKLVATICSACVVPAQAGILDDLTATVYPTDQTKRIFEDAGVTYSDEGCVVLKDENIVTAQGPKYAEAFGQAILESL